MLKPNLILRIAVGIILLSHSIFGMFDGGVNAFGKFYLNEIGFAPFGVAIAWAIKISHVICALLLFANKYIKVASILTILILIMGIILIHFKEGWFVVGGGRNGMEYNFLLIAVLVQIMINDGAEKINRNPLD
ncbi:DoxX family protein [Pedobacter polaris]|uniref:DoxX family protein n=1 Tax=Pedobacter polaris TaxID=2571273 RepID=A0A4U1CVQ6_9SPHI|nr:DoxX family protein [Pedobacter polaris]TKC12933.1 DoxX family protein [Pedobacter polaris]